MKKPKSPTSNNDVPQEHSDGRGAGHDVLRDVEIIPAIDLIHAREDPEDPEVALDEDDAAEPTSARRPYFDSLTTASALRETIDSALEIIDIMMRFGGSTDTRRKTSLWVEVAECERGSIDLSHRMALLRRRLFT